MCGRFTLRASARVIAEQFGLFELPPFAARFNIAPMQLVPVIRQCEKGVGSLLPERPDGGHRREALVVAQKTPDPFFRELVWLRWGLVPGWAQDPAIGNRLINARAETAAEKPAFRAALRRRRCLIAADGFYEWQQAKKGTGPICAQHPEGRSGKLDPSPFSQRGKQPYFIRLRNDQPFAFAGLWEVWEGPDRAHEQVGNLSHGSRLETCTLLTASPNDLLRPIHDRMPVIVAPDDYRRWLDPAVEDPRQLAPLLVPYPSEPMEAYPVGGLVNNPTHESPRCIEPTA
jgi:putative SOS response-associated peptidase YedK